VSRTTLDKFEDRYARRMHGMRASAMRDLMAITVRPEVISLAGGLPDTSAFDSKLLASICTDIAMKASAGALQYGPTEGLPLVKRAITEVMAAEDMVVHEDDMLVTTGGQQVLDMFARTFIDPGDVVIAEGPTYPGAVPVFANFQADVRHVPLDEDGLDPAAVEQLLDDLQTEGVRPKYLYTIPTFQNPGGTTTTLERRKRLVELAAERDLLVLEDNPYSMLRYDGEPVPTLRSLDTHGNVAYLGTFSKIFAPGVRLGWIEAPAPILSRINLVKAAADLCSSPFNQMLVASFFLEHDWRGYIARLCDVYRSRRDAMLEALEEHFPPGTSWTTPEGGLFIWATLPAVVDTQDLLARALKENVAFVPGSGAFLDGTGGNSMRLNFSAVPEDRIREGIKRLGTVISEVIELAERLGVSSDRPAATQEAAG
jgi:2-aminoadipate transaminase